MVCCGRQPDPGDVWAHDPFIRRLRRNPGACLRLPLPSYLMASKESATPIAAPTRVSVPPVLSPFGDQALRDYDNRAVSHMHYFVRRAACYQRCQVAPAP
jgi:hypothetical protein